MSNDLYTYTAILSAKPNDMPLREWEALCMTLGDNPQCVRLKQGLCKKPCTLRSDGNYPVQWDHIVSRDKGGPTVAQNMQLLCDVPNAIKQNKPDGYWEASRFFFDLEPNERKLRPGQVQFAWNQAKILAEAMLKKNVDIYRVYLLLWWIVGSGKTIAMVVVCMAINYVILRSGQVGTPRINKLLVLVKEAALRDSIYHELSKDLTGYEIAPRGPVVRRIESGDQWRQKGFVDQADIVVACVHQLWEKDTNRPRPDLETASILSDFHAIAIDECHFGHGQLERLAHLTPLSLKFGFSNTPINDIGDILGRFVLFSMLDYDYAFSADKSLKRLPLFEEGVKSGYYVEVKPDKHAVMESGIEGALKTGLHGDKDSAWVWYNVCLSVIEQLSYLDEYAKANAPEHWFSSHALIKASTVDSARQICAMINIFLEKHRGKFPIKDGWRAVYIHGAMTGTSDQKIPLDERRLIHSIEKENRGIIHPWMRAKTLPGYRCDDRCARILVAVDMVREGINNPLCNTVGWTCPSLALIELIQRIGRPMRELYDLRGSDILRRLRTVHLFWHAIHPENGKKIEEAIDWMRDMQREAVNPRDGKGKAIVTLEAFLEDGTLSSEIQKGHLQNILSPRDKDSLERALGEAILSNRPTVPEIIVDTPNVLAAPVSGERRQRAIEFVHDVTHDPIIQEMRVGVLSLIEPLRLCCYEKPQESYSYEALERFVDMEYAHKSPEKRERLKTKLHSDEDWKEELEDKKRKRDEIFAEAIPTSDRSIVGKGSVVNELTGKFINRYANVLIRDPMKCSSDFQLVVRYVTSAAAVICGTHELVNNGPFDRVEYHVALTRPSVQDAIFDLVRLQLMIDNCMPALAALYPDQIENRQDQRQTLWDFVDYYRAKAGVNGRKSA